MQIQGTHTFKAPQQAVWDALQDPTILSTALPGGEQLVKVGENDYKAVMNVRVGPVQGKFEGKIELTDINEPTSYRMKVSGQGSPGFVNGEGNVQLSANGDETVMSYTGDVQVGGKIAGVGQRLIDSTAKSIIRQGLIALDAQIQARLTQATAPANEVPATPSAPTAPASDPTPPSAVPASATPASAVSPAPPPVAKPVTPPSLPPKTATAGPSAAKIATEVAKDVTRDLVSDVIPLQHQEKVLWFAFGALAMLILDFVLNQLSE